MKREIPHIRLKALSQKALGKLTLLVFGTLAFVLLYSAYHIMPFYYYYYELQNQFESHAKAAVIYTDKELRQKLLYQIKRMEIPASPQDLKIQRVGNKITISMPYSEVFYVSWGGKDYDIHTFHFNPYVSVDLK